MVKQKGVVCYHFENRNQEFTFEPRQLSGWALERARDFFQIGHPFLALAFLLQGVSDILSALLFVVLRKPFQWIVDALYEALPDDAEDRIDALRKRHET